MTVRFPACENVGEVFFTTKLFIPSTTGGLADGEEAAYALDATRWAEGAPRAMCATQRRTGQIYRVVALRIIAGAGRGGMNPQVFSGPDLTAIDSSRPAPFQAIAVFF